MKNYSKSFLKSEIVNNLGKFRTTPEDASFNKIYKAVAITVNGLLSNRIKHFKARNASQGRKQVNYLSMEFLMGRSLKNNMFNLGITDIVADILKDFGVDINDIYECEPDAGLGNGGLGRLAACYLDGMATLGISSYGYSILYEFGIFSQKIVDGWQTELPDNWLPGGEVWLNPQPELTIDVHFDGEIEEFWDEDGFHCSRHKNYSIVRAVPYDMYVSGYKSDAVAVLRLFKAESPAFDMDSFNKGDYSAALGKSVEAEAISKILYPNDNHFQGKLLRLRQQYFLSAAAIGDITNRHIREYGTLENFADKNAIHINDTHPTLSIPELMRILLDDCGYSWEKSWEITKNTFNYTNHTVMSEALEVWNEQTFKETLPRIYQIVKEIDNRFNADMQSKFGWDQLRINRMKIIEDGKIKMANLCVYASNKVNGVSKLHSQILKDDLFNDFYRETPEKFTNVTNGIAFRRWLNQSNPGLTKLLQDTIGDGFDTNSQELKKFEKYAGRKDVQDRLFEVKRENKQRLAEYVYKKNKIKLNPDSIFDVQVKRMHEYKRQHLNALNIITDYLYLKDHKNAAFVPKTYIFGAKAAPGYYMAKKIIHLLCCLSSMIDKDDTLKDKLKVVYLENYSVTLSELIMPASEVSEQISLAGTEASGTGNMKFMLNGAITLGTEDGANVEIHESVSDDNIIIFGMSADEVAHQKEIGYYPAEFYNKNPDIKRAIDFIDNKIEGFDFSDVTNSLKSTDPFMVLADFESYRKAQKRISKIYLDKSRWNKMSAINIANAGYFSGDRAIEEYAQNIWDIDTRK